MNQIYLTRLKLGILMLFTSISMMAQITILPTNVTTLAGSAWGYADGTGTGAQFYSPVTMAYDNAGNIYVADASNSRIRKIVISTGEVTTFAGSSQGYADGTGTAAQFWYPSSIVYDGAGNLYVGDLGNWRIRKIVIATAEVTTIAGDGTRGGTNGTLLGSSFDNTYLAWGGSDILYVADHSRHTVRKIDITNNTVTAIAGSDDVAGDVDGIGSAARFQSPSGIAYINGDLYIGDSYNRKIKQINLTTNAVTTVAGSIDGNADGTGTAAEFGYISHLQFDGFNSIYITTRETGQNRVRRMDLTTTDVTTLAGSTDGQVNGVGTNAQFAGPGGMCLDENGNLYLTDIGTLHLIKKVEKVSHTFSTTEGTPSDAQTFTVLTTGLSGNLQIQALSGYEYSTDDITYSSSLSLTPADPAETVIYVRLSGEAAGTFNGNVVCTDGSTSATVAVEGEVTGTGTAPILSGCNFGGDETTTIFTGTIDDNGGSTITACGFIWGTTDVVADLISGVGTTSTDVPADAIVQTGDFSATLNTDDLPANYSFIPYATNANGTTYGDAACSQIIPDLSCNYSNLTSTSVTLEGAVIDDMGLVFVSYGFFYTDDMMSPTPTIVAATSGDASGFSVDITGLIPGTTYFFMPFGEDSEGHQAGDMDICQFTTPVEATGTAIINGCNFGGDETTTTFIGSILTNGGNTITECGFYYGTDDNAAGLIANGTKLVSITTVQEGEFSADIATASLPMNYYFVPYAINGDGLSYGEMPCSSETIVPEFSCNSTNLTSTSVTLEGAVIKDMGLVFVSYGFWYGSDPESEPITVAATAGDASGFSVDITGLTPGTTYFFMPYGEDSEGHQAGGMDFCQFTTPVEATGTAIINGCNFGGDETTTIFIGSILTNGGSTITECGFYWGTDDNAAGLIANGTKLVSITTVQEGEFSADIATADLPMNYYFVPYAINGDGLSYGEMPCSSETIVPEFSCNSTNLTSTSVTLEGAVIDDMGLEFVNYGFWYGSNMESEPATVAATSGDATGFTVNLTGLTPGTTYFFMPFGVDNEGHQAAGMDFCQFTTLTINSLKIPNVFTPNGDNINDMFVIEGIEAYPNNTMLILNRWGNKVYESKSYKNEWDGRNSYGVSVSKDDILPEGLYYYILDLGDGSEIRKGSIYLKKQ